MCLLLESINITNGVALHLPYHQRRLEATRKALLKLTDGSIRLEEVMATCHPEPRGIFKARVVYGRVVEQVQLVPYQPRQVKSLKLVDGNHLTYSHKLANRAMLDELVQKREGADDILIVKDGMLTDTSYANIALWDGSGWFTPSSPLLPGIKRQALLDLGKLTECSITPGDLSAFEKLSLINAMLDPGDVEIPVNNIIY